MRNEVQWTKNRETSQRILAAAECIFAERGLAGARTDAIAAAAHANKAMLYYYFGSKQKLHRAVLEHLLRQVRDKVQGAIPPEGAPREKLLAFAGAYFDFLAAHPNYPRLIQLTWLHSGELLDWVAKTYFRPLLTWLCEMIEEGMRAGEFRKVDPMQIAFTILSLTGSYFATAPLMSRVFRRSVLEPAALAQRRKAMLDFLENGLNVRRARSQ
jgi:TetR/AcrR family transcriptional regulator